jgi:hypothetical protein
MTFLVQSRLDAVRLADRVLVFFSNLATKAGNLVRTVAEPFHLATGCGSGSGGGGGPAPCACGWPSGLSNTYTVGGFGGLSACSECDSSGDPPWPGTLYHAGGGCVWWAIDPGFDSFSISGATLDITYTQVLLRTTVTPCRWELYIACTSLTHPTKTMWYGYKTTGSTPAGTYSFVGSDCGNATPTMTVS